MRKIVIGIGIFVVLIIVAVGIFVLTFNPNDYRNTVQAQLEKQLNRKVSLGEMSLGLFPPRFEVSNLAIQDDPAFGSRAPFVQTQTLDVSVKLLPLLSKKVEIDSLELKKPKVELIKDPQGAWNFSTIGQKNAPSSPSSGNQDFSLGKLQITDGQVAITDNRARTPRTVYDHINVLLKDFSPSSPFSLDASVQLPGPGSQDIRLQGKGGPLAKDPAATPFHGALDLKNVSVAQFQKFLQSPALANTDGVLSGHTNIGSENGKLSAAGQMNVDKPKIQGIDVGYPINANYDINDDLVSDLLRVNKCQIKLGPTPLDVTGTVNSKPVPSQLDLRLKANNVSIAELAKLAAAAGKAFSPGTNVTGNVNADIQARGPSNKPELNGTVTGQNIQASGKDIPQPVQVKAVNINLTPAEIRSDNFNVTSGGTTVNTQFSLKQYSSSNPQVDASLKAPQAQLPAILSMAKAWGVTGLDKLSGAGTLNLDMHAAGPLASLSSDQIMRALNGTAALNFANVRYSGVDLNHQIAQLGGFLGKAQTSGKDQGYTNIQKVTGNIVVKNGIAQTSNLQALLDIANVGATGTANLATQALNLNVTAVLSKATSQQVGGSQAGSYMNTALANNQGEIVIPATVTGTFDHPVFAPDVQKIAQMKLKGLMPSADNPLGGGAGVLGGLLGQKGATPANKGQPQQQQQDPVNQLMGVFGKKKK
jgi:AsmA protein